MPSKHFHNVDETNTNAFEISQWLTVGWKMQVNMVFLTLKSCVFFLFFYFGVDGEYSMFLKILVYCILNFNFCFQDVIYYWLNFLSFLGTMNICLCLHVEEAVQDLQFKLSADTFSIFIRQVFAMFSPWWITLTSSCSCV